jgi:hypothetical protein
MAKEEIKETVPFSFDEIYDGIAELFEAKGYDSPYDGSNLSQLITSMAYTTSMLNANTAININETILTLAQKRENIVQDARLLGYEATQRISYVYEIELTFTETKLYNIPHLAVFTSGGNTYYYTGDDFDFDATAGDTKKILVKEGKLITYLDEPENLRQVIGSEQYLDIPYPNVESDGIEVYITYYQDDGILSNRERFFKSPTLLIDIDDNLSKKFIRLENIDMDTPRIHFTLSNVGNEVPRGAVVEMNVIQSKGPDGSTTDDFKTDIAGINIENYELSIRGNNIESNQSIKDNAPVLHNTASRCVTANDYEVIAKKHSACKEAFVFGGEDEHPIKLGHIFLSLTPEKSTRTFTQNTENTEWVLDNLEVIENNYLLPQELESNEVDVNGNIKNPGVLDNIKALNLPSLRYNIRNPLYILMDFDIRIVKYALSSVHTEVRQTIFDLLSEYILELETYSTEFFKSNAIKKLDSFLTDITGLEMSVAFKIMIDKNSVSEESTQAIQGQSIVEVTENNIVLYLDTPYENIYADTGLILLPNLPRIDTVNFVPGKDLSVDFTHPYVIPETIPGNPDELSKSKDSIEFPVYLGPIDTTDLSVNKVGTYTIYNDRTTYIRVKINTDSFYNELDTARFITLKYPSENIKTLRSGIFKLNKVSIT